MTHSDPTQSTDPGIEHEERHDVGSRIGLDEPIHEGPGAIASDVEANATRPAGPDIRAEETAAQGYDPETPPPASETEHGPG